jgi:hypothetical protein
MLFESLHQSIVKCELYIYNDNVEVDKSAMLSAIYDYS